MKVLGLLPVFVKVVHIRHSPIMKEIILEVALVSGALTLSGYSQLTSDFSGLTCMGTNNNTFIAAKSVFSDTYS